MALGHHLRKGGGMDWEAVSRIAGELANTAGLAMQPKSDETERALCRYTVEDLQDQLGRAMRGES